MTGAGEDQETGRVEAFSDGVIAIALLILDVKVPKPAEADAAGSLTRLFGDPASRM